MMMAVSGIPNVIHTLEDEELLGLTHLVWIIPLAKA